MTAKERSFHRAMCQKNSCSTCDGGLERYQAAASWLAKREAPGDLGGFYRPFANFYGVQRPWYDRADWFDHLVREMARG